MRALAIFYDGNEHRVRACETDQPDSQHPAHFELVDQFGPLGGTIADAYPLTPNDGVFAVITEGPRFDTTPDSVLSHEFLSVFVNGGPIDPTLAEADGTGSDEGNEEASTD